MGTSHLEDLSGSHMVNIGITLLGEILAAQGCRACPDAGRPLDLIDASARVRNRRAIATRAAEYVYFDNVAQAGYSRLTPLAAVTTDRGTVYFNSKGEAFAEEGAPIIDDVGGESATGALQVRGPMLRLRSMGQW